ncbi:MAG: T9SS type A sorting domain-containing protein [Bacteroidota bacterium]
MKKFNVLLALAFCTSLLYAQYPENWSVRYQTTTSNNFSNEGRKVAIDAVGNCFVLGDYSSDLDSAGHAAGSTQYTVRIQKFDVLGTLLTWAYIPVAGLINNGFDNRSAFGLELDVTGNVFIGYSVLNGSGNFDVVIAKYSNALVKSWTLTYSTSSNDIGVDLKLKGFKPYVLVKSYLGANATYSIVTADAGGFITTPLYSFVPNVDVVNALNLTGNKVIYVTGYSIVSGAKSVMTAAVSLVGTLKWKVNYNHNSIAGDDYGSNLMIGSDGDIYIVGTTYSGAAFGNDGLLLKYNTSGLSQGALFFNQSAVDVGDAISNAPAGFVYVACSNLNSITVYKIRMNPLGLTANAIYYPVPSSSYTSITGVNVADIKTATSGNVYVCGSVTAISASGGFSASFLAKFGMNGFFFKMLNQQDREGSYIDNYNSVNMVLDGAKNDVMLLRNYWSNNSNHAQEKYKLSDLDGGTSLRLTNDALDNNQDKTTFSLYPNPAADVVSVRSNEKIAIIEISDLTGQVVKSVKVNSPADVNIGISDMKKGLYVCRIITESGSVQLKKLVIE